MRLLVIVIAISIVITSCSNNKVINQDSIWISSYFKFSDNIASPDFLSSLIEIKQKELKYICLDFENTKKITPLKYYIQNNTFFFYNDLECDSLLILYASSDSIIFARHDRESELVFKRINLSESPKKIPLIGNAFTINATGYQDTIEFINDSLCLLESMPVSNSKLLYWKTFTYKKLSFLLIDSYLFPPMLIHSIQNKTINTNIYYTSVQKVQFRKLSSQFKYSLLNGKWRATTDSFLPPPPELNYIPVSIEFRDTILSIQYNNRTLQYNWFASKYLPYIFFISPLDNYTNVWKIKTLNNNLLIIEKTNSDFRDNLNQTFRFTR